jgi:hypothetical protein
LSLQNTLKTSYFSWLLINCHEVEMDWTFLSHAFKLCLYEPCFCDISIGISQASRVMHAYLVLLLPWLQKVPAVFPRWYWYSRFGFSLNSGYNYLFVLFNLQKHFYYYPPACLFSYLLHVHFSSLACLFIISFMKLLS